MPLSFGWEEGDKDLARPGAVRMGWGRGCQKRQSDERQNCEQPCRLVRPLFVAHFVPPMDYDLVISQEMSC